MPTIRFEEVSKTYENGYLALKSVSFTINEGEFFVLVGPSGCGKSTLLRSVAGLEQIQSGNIYFGDENITSYEPKNRNIGMVFQNYALYPHLTVFENIAFPLQIQKKPKIEIDTLVRSVAKQVSLEQLLDRKPKELSGGQRQRVALARALVKNPNVYLFDEPLSNLDAHLRAQMRIEILSLRKKFQKTSIYVTHDQTEAMTMATRIAVMKEGNIVQIGTPTELYSNPKTHFVATFIGSPTINTFEGVFKSNNGNFFFEDIQSGIQFSVPSIPKDYITNTEILFCFRAESCRIASTLEESGSISFDLVEYLGNESLGYFSANIRNMIVRLPADFTIVPGQKYTLHSNGTNYFFFDILSGERIFTEE